MPINPQQTTYFKQARFTTRLPNGYLYSPSHYWVRESSPGVLQIGMTKFATRMLGDFVEYNLSVNPGDVLAVGEPIGILEGFKAVADIYCAVAGEFLGGNPLLEQQPELVDTDPYDRAWLYQVRAALPEDLLDVTGYIGILNATIERMLAESKAEEDRNC
jgi:glycine cleavage system H protein